MQPVTSFICILDYFNSGDNSADNIHWRKKHEINWDIYSYTLLRKKMLLL